MSVTHLLISSAIRIQKPTKASSSSGLSTIPEFTPPPESMKARSASPCSLMRCPGLCTIAMSLTRHPARPVSSRFPYGEISSRPTYIGSSREKKIRNCSIVEARVVGLRKMQMCLKALDRAINTCTLQERRREPTTVVTS
jgi:hypothetical protein